jgi:protein-S-isoprenylcysteine O-methyltransferase Ste14
VYQAFLPMLAVTVLAVTTFRWTTEEMQLNGHLSQGASRTVAALVGLHAMIVVIAAGGGALVIGVPLLPRLVVGVPIALAGFGLAIAAARALGSWSVIFGARTDCFVTTGPYRRMRHPLFVGWTATLGGIALAGASILAVVFVLLLGAALAALTRGEDARMTERFGSAYADWKALLREKPPLVEPSTTG